MPLLQLFMLFNMCEKDDDRYFIQQLTKKFETDLYNPKEGEINKSRILLGIISALYEKSEANPPQYITQPGGQRLLNSDYYLRDLSKRLSEKARNLEENLIKELSSRIST